MRQWVCSLPWRLRYAMGYDRRLCADVLAVFIAALRRSLRHRAELELGLRSVDDAQVGALTFVQRGDSSLRLNVHFHTLALDGVYVRDVAGVLRFHALPTPTPEHVAEGFGVQVVGRAEGISERFYAISVERRLEHPGVVAISESAKTTLFG